MDKLAIQNTFFNKIENKYLIFAFFIPMLVYSGGFDLSLILENINSKPYKGFLELQSIVINAFIEEILFRLLTFRVITMIIYKENISLFNSFLLTSFVFGICHFINITNSNLQSTLNQCFGAFSIGMLLQVVFFLQKNLTLVIVMHILINLLSTFSQPVHSNISTYNKFNVISFIVTLIIYSIPFCISLLLLKKFNLLTKKKLHV